MFGLVCVLKYYDDMGYFGYISCFENFNINLEYYGVQVWEGWFVINFFFNIGVDDYYVMYLDELYLCFGDYILLKVLMDIVCVFFVCLDDIILVNGWNFIDIYVWIYLVKNLFFKVIVIRMIFEFDVKMI